MSSDPFAVLGLANTASADDVHAARRHLSKRVHPDVGGSESMMQELNSAARDALALIEQRRSPSWSQTQRRHDPRRPEADHSKATTDHPSFTIEALPAEAFEGLVVVASWIGDLIDDDPPYRLDVQLDDPFRAWCRLELVPDAGSSSVSLTLAARPGEHLPDLDTVRDTWVSNLNLLDWERLDSARRPP